MNWTDAWVAILTAGLAYALWRQRGLTKELRQSTNRLALDQEQLRVEVSGKADKKEPTPRLRARRVKPTKPLYDFGSGEVIGHECPKCGARVPEMGHTVAACEKHQATLKRSHEVATAGIEENQITDLKN